MKLHENERMLSLAACSSASISFSKVDKTLRFEARLINQLKICEGSFIRSLDFLLLFDQAKSKEKKELSEAKRKITTKKKCLSKAKTNQSSLAKSQQQQISRLAHYPLE